MEEKESEPEHIRLVKETELYKNCTNIVIGKGNLNANILFVGEAPGKNEDEQGLPFVGRAGKNLDELLAKVGLSLDDIYIANILKCRPPENRNPLPEEIRAHTPWLIEQIKQMKPKVVCSLGNYATKLFLSEGDKVKLIPLFHPAAIIYKRDLIPLWEKDMEVVKKEIKESVEQKKLI